MGWGLSTAIPCRTHCTPILALPLGEGREDRVPHALNDVRTKVP